MNSGFNLQAPREWLKIRGVTANPRIRRVIRTTRYRYGRLRERYFLDYVFIHINKTGGTSVETALGAPHQHRTALQKIADLGLEAWNARFTFTVVRNPWDRVVSQYHYRVMTNQNDLGTNPITFNEWVKRTFGMNDPRYYDNPKSFMPQLEWIADSAGRVLVNFVARFENLEGDFAAICERLGRRAELPHLKRSPRGDYRMYYEDETIETVHAWFIKDTEEFGYEFDSS